MDSILLSKREFSHKKKEGSLFKIEKENQISTLSHLFQLAPEIVEEALKIIEKR